MSFTRVRSSADDLHLLSSKPQPPEAEPASEKSQKIVRVSPVDVTAPGAEKAKYIGYAHFLNRSIPGVHPPVEEVREDLRIFLEDHEDLSPDLCYYNQYGIVLITQPLGDRR